MKRLSKTAEKNMGLMQEAMELMAQSGISPMKFVDKLCNNRFFNESLEKCVILAEQENLMAPDIMRATRELRDALSELSNRYQTSSYLQKIINNPEFTNEILNLINSLRLNLQQPSGQHEHPEFQNYFTGFEKPSGAGDHAGGEDTPKENTNPYIMKSIGSGEKAKNLAEIRTLVKEFLNEGINPDDVLDGYVNSLRGRIDENLFRAIGDWLSRQKTNLTNFFATGKYAGGMQAQELRDQMRDTPIIIDVQKKLQNLEDAMHHYGILPTTDFRHYATELKKQLKFGVEAGNRMAKQKDPAVDSKTTGYGSPRPGPDSSSPVSVASSLPPGISFTQGQKPAATSTAPVSPHGPSTAGSALNITLPEKPAQKPGMDLEALAKHAAQNQNPTQDSNDDMERRRKAKKAEEARRAAERYMKKESKKHQEDKSFLESIFGSVRDAKKTWLN